VISLTARPCWHRIKLLAAERECYHLKAPPNQLVYWFIGKSEETKAAIAADRGFDIPSGDGVISGPFGIRRPARWVQFENLLRQNISKPPYRYSSFDRLPVIFVGQLKSPGNTRRLVSLEMHDDSVGFGVPDPAFFITKVPPVPFIREPTMEIQYVDAYDSSQVRQFLDPNNFNGTDLRLFAGQVDPKDPSHFTVQVHIDEKRQVIEGWLRDDGTVSLAIRGMSPLNSK
jgi:hypothetical protein